MHGSYNEFIFWFMCYGIAFASSISRSSCDPDPIPVTRQLGSGSSAGFFTIAIIGLFGGSSIASASGQYFFVGVAAVVGLLGREQDKYVKLIVSKAIRILTEKEKDV